MGTGPAWRVGLHGRSQKKEVFSFGSSREVEAELVGKYIVSSERDCHRTGGGEQRPNQTGTLKKPPSVVFRTGDGGEYRLRVFPGWRGRGRHRWRFVETASDSFAGQQPPAQQTPQKHQQQSTQTPSQQQMQRRRSSAPPQSTPHAPSSPTSVIVREPVSRDYPLYVLHAYYLPEALCIRAAREHPSRVLLRWAYVCAFRKGGRAEAVCSSATTRNSISCWDMHRTPSTASSAGLSCTPSSGSSAPGTPARGVPGSGRFAAATPVPISIPTASAGSVVAGERVSPVSVSSSAVLAAAANSDNPPRDEQQQAQEQRQSAVEFSADTPASPALARLPVALVRAVEAFLPVHGETLQWRWGIRNDQTHTPQLERVVRKTPSPKKKNK